ncbi:MAG TPA: TonB-dependent receptor plug domain-containing protein [Saprospiraceae bacterium]|nr:TonB-dependent receptor plug domain-containing protein [Saprospiraceae bacterium]HMQ83223.1 TonB-dependent receptor plug domain-containing protein [Saprospiraceae bacterium]
MRYLMVLFLITPLYMWGQLSISGYVTAEEGEALIAAHVFDTLSQQGVLSNTYGFFHINIPKGEKVVLRFSFVGYKDTIIRIDSPGKHTLNAVLEPYFLQEIVVKANAQPYEAAKIGAVQLPVQQIERMPSMLGETDVLKALTLLPGVSGGTEGTSNIFVRGGTPDQNLILLDDAPVYNVNHLFGFLSLFNSDAIKNVELYKSSFPARYGGRLSSVLKISMKEGNRERINKKLSIGLIASRLMLDGPLGKSKRTTFLCSARSSYLDLLTLPQRIAFEGSGSDFFNYSLYDINAKISHQLNERHRLFLSYYGGKDRFTQNFKDIAGTERTGLKWGNQTLTLRSAKQLGHSAFLNTSLIYSRYQFEQFSEDIRSQPDPAKQFYSSSSGLRSFQARQTLEYKPLPAHDVSAGFEATAWRFTPQKNELKASNQPDFFFKEVRDATSLSFFLEDDFQATRYLGFNLGLRWNQYSISGSSYQYWEPRLASRINLPEGIQWKTSLSWMHQPLHLLTNNGVGLPNDIWVPATANTPPQQSRQWSSGLFKYFENMGLEVSLEYYQKYSRNLIDYRDGSNFLEALDQNWESIIERQGEGWSEGIEFFLHKKTGRLNGLLSYTLSKHDRRFEGINGGNKYPFQFDRRHDFSASLNYQLNKAWNIACSGIFHTGNAITLPTEKYPVPSDLATYSGGYVFTYDQRNGYRLPNYHRADLGFAHTKSKGKFGSREWRFGVYNLYSRENTYYIQSENVRIYEPGTLNIIDWDVRLRNRYLFRLLPYVAFTRSW